MSNVVGTRTLSYSALEALQRFYAAEEQYVSSGGLDFDAVANTIHPDIVLFQAASLPYGGEYRGHSSFKNWLDRMAEAWSSVRAQGPVFIEHGADTIISLVTMEAEARATRRHIKMPVCQVVRVQDGLPIEWRVFYWDTFALNDALGHSPRRNR
ncbi:nuclear transport factor 2 family protein [Brucella cytisi]|jgi:ketosteroid isomerase-like protein|uniref:nuclear transport factor 2 family protein n=1 Tax=Brucella cytisi TaxID=407152 RepID=UPI0035D8080D